MTDVAVFWMVVLLARTEAASVVEDAMLAYSVFTRDDDSEGGEGME